VTFSSLLVSLGTFLFIVYYVKATPSETIRLLGWWPISLTDVAKTQLLVAILFAGPLFEAGIVEGQWLDWIRGTHLKQTLGSWIGRRNYIAVFDAQIAHCFL
jgi:prenyl protein peptidase